MRRVSAMLLTVWISALLMLPVLAGGAQNRLPACCRAAGKHHCSLQHAAPDGSGPAWHAAGATCPLWHVEAALPAPAAAPAGFASVAQHVDLKAHAQLHARPVSLYRPAFSRSRQKRGPPVFFA